MILDGEILIRELANTFLGLGLGYKFYNIHTQHLKSRYHALAKTPLGSSSLLP